MSNNLIQIMSNSRALQREPCLRKNRGFTLLEALIGFLVLSIGMLGIASLQAISLQAGKTSVYNSVAMLKVEELFESMRANPSALGAYAGGGANSACATNVCTPAQLAAEDVFLWKANLKAGLPSTDTTTTVTVIPAGGTSNMSKVTVTIGWKERNRDATAAGDSASVEKTYVAKTNICTSVLC